MPTAHPITTPLTPERPMYGSPDRQAQRHKLLATATHILQQEGAQALSLRHIATQADTSTQMIYTLFGGKEGLIQALYEEGFARQEAWLGQVSYQQDGRAYLRALLLACRAFAHQEPLLYEIMFGRLIPEFEPPLAESMRRCGAYVLLSQVVASQLVGIKSPERARAVTDALWLALHGALRMELRGFYEDEAQALERFELTMEALVNALLEPSASGGPKPRSATAQDFFTSI